MIILIHVMSNVIHLVLWCSFRICVNLPAEKLSVFSSRAMTFPFFSIFAAKPLFSPALVYLYDLPSIFRFVNLFYLYSSPSYYRPLSPLISRSFSSIFLRFSFYYFINFSFPRISLCCCFIQSVIAAKWVRVLPKPGHANITRWTGRRPLFSRRSRCDSSLSTDYAALPIRTESSRTAFKSRRKACTLIFFQNSCEGDDPFLVNGPLMALSCEAVNVFTANFQIPGVEAFRSGVSFPEPLINLCFGRYLAKPMARSSEIWKPEQNLDSTLLQKILDRTYFNIL